jgi:eukaryotic-like serine/threonine-protein kinase
MALEPGTRLGPYEILAPLGAAESGEVYKATDTRLNRAVAITVLPPEFAAPELKERLERDVRTISSLNHPQICKPVDVGHQDPATDFVVAEFVEGETLAQRLTRGPLDLHEALKIAIAMADALDKAHRMGVTHGALNPSVVMLTANGPKVLDFGLVSLQADSSPLLAGSLATTRTSVSSLSAVPTYAAPYTAPEQFAGQRADARSDIFATGAILYEMVTGRPAFKEPTLALLIAAVQTVDPEPASKVQPMVPAALDHLIRRCLTKDPRQRLQTAWDLLIQLKWVAEGGTQVGVPAPIAARRRLQDRAVWASLAVASVLAVGLAPAALSRFRAAPGQRDARFLVTTVGAAPGVPISISPDGRWIVGSKGGANPGLDAVVLNSVTTQVLLRGMNVVQPFWSPDSRSIAFIDPGDSKLKKAEVAGGPPQTICEPPTPFGGGTWNRDGVILFSGAGVIQRVLAAGGQPTAVTELDKSRQETEHMSPDFLPDGRHYVFLSVSSQPGESAIYAGSLDTKERTRLFPSETKAVYAAPGYLLFNRDNAVFAQAFDADRLALSGEAIRVADGVPNYGFATGGVPSQVAGSSLTRGAIFAVSQTGVLAYRTGASPTAAPTGTAEEQRALVWFDRAGAQSRAVETLGAYGGMDLSPDGKQFAVHRHEAGGGDNWVFDATGRLRRLTFDTRQDNSSPIWSPDGTRIAFASRRDNKWGLYVKPADGTTAEELVTESEAIKMPMSWSPDGKLLVYIQQGGSLDVWAVPLAGDKKPFPLLQSQFAENFPQVSPDGKWMAYQSGETGRNEIYVKPFPDGAVKWQVSTEGGQWPRWRGDGKELYFILPPTMRAVEVRVVGSSIQAGIPQVLFGIPNPSIGLAHPPYHRFAVSPDGRRFLMSQAGGGPVAGGLADNIAALADRGGAAASSVAPQTITVVLDWPRMLVGQ